MERIDVKIKNNADFCSPSNRLSSALIKALIDEAEKTIKLYEDYNRKCEFNARVLQPFEAEIADFRREIKKRLTKEKEKAFAASSKTIEDLDKRRLAFHISEQEQLKKEIIEEFGIYRPDLHELFAETIKLKKLTATMRNEGFFGNRSSLCQETSPTISSPLVMSAAIGPSCMSAFTSPIHSASGTHHHCHSISSSVPQQLDGFGISTSMDGQSAFFMGQQRQPLSPFQPLLQTRCSDINGESQGHNEVGSVIPNCGYRPQSMQNRGPSFISVAAAIPPLVSQRAESMSCPRTLPQQNMYSDHPPRYLSSTDGTVVSHTQSRSQSIHHPPTHVPVPKKSIKN